jgi:hypothetical protein
MKKTQTASQPASASSAARALTSATSTASSTEPSASTRSLTSTRSGRSTTGVKDPFSPQVVGRSRRRISSTSRNPSVVMIPVRAPLRSSSALVPTVVPCTTVEMSAKFSTLLAMPSTKPFDWSPRVDGTLAVNT